MLQTNDKYNNNNNNNNNNNHVMPLAWISLTLSRHFSLSFISSGRSSGLHPVSPHNCCMYVRAGRPAFAWPYAGVHRSTSLKRLKKKLDGNYTRMFRAILNKSWRQHTTRHQLYGHLSPNSKTIQVRRTRHARTNSSVMYEQ